MMFQGSFEKHDPALDSGVCPSPDECYQNYYDAFPPLLPSTFGNNDDLRDSLAASTCHKWQNTKRSMVDVLRRTSSSSSPPACLTTTSLSREVSKSSHSAPSPTLLDHTPNKRQKLLSSKSGINQADIVTNQSLSGIVDNNRSPTFFETVLHSAEKPRSCPTVSSSRRKLSPSTAPNFCCPQVTQSADGGLAAYLPVFEANESSQTAAALWPHFVVPKCFKVGSWPMSKNDRQHPTSDVPFWSCGEWFCTVHKGVQFSLLSAKVDDDAAKVLSPDPLHQHMASSRWNEQSSCVGKIENSDGCGPVDEEKFFDARAGGDAGDLPVVGQFFDIDDACPLENWDSSLNVNNTCTTWDSKTLSNSGHIEIPSSYDQLKADVFNTVQLESQWPSSDVDLNSHPRAQYDVPEFDPFASSSFNNNFPAIQDLTGGGGQFQSVQEVGFCLPKFDLSPTTLVSKGSNVTKSYGSYASSYNNFKQPTCVPPPEIEIMQPSSDMFDIGGSVNNSCKQRAVAAVPISPQTHFVPIRSESMEDAYLLQKPAILEDAAATCTCCAEHGRNANKKGLAYIEDTGYYIFLHPDKSSSRCHGDHLDQPQTISSSIVDCNANKMSGDCCCCSTCHACKVAPQPLIKLSKSLGTLDLGISARTRRCRSPFSVKFRASKPGKMVQTEDKYFLYCSDGGDRYPLYCTDDFQENNDDPFLCDLDIDDLLAEEAPLDLASPHEDQGDKNNNNQGGGCGDFFEIWACNTLPVPEDPCSQQAKWSSPNVAKQLLASSLSTDNRRPPLLFAASSVSFDSGAAVHNNDALQLAAWRREDERDEELLLHYVSNISLISPLDLDESYDDDGIDSPA